MPAERSRSSGVSLKTLVIASLSSVAAALIVPLIWQPGTVFAAALTPVIVTIMTALLDRPVDTVSAVAAAPLKLAGGAKADKGPDDDFDPLAPPPREDLDALNRDVGAPAPVARHGHAPRRRLTGRQWRLAIGTGLLAFVVAAAIITVTELAAGDAVTSPRGRTSLFGGSDKQEEKATPTPTPTPDATPTETPEDATPTPEPTETPAETATPTPTPGAAEAPAPATAPPTEEAPTATPAP